LNDTGHSRSDVSPGGYDNIVTDDNKSVWLPEVKFSIDFCISDGTLRHFDILDVNGGDAGWG
jgi:hypothetical protein